MNYFNIINNNMTSTIEIGTVTTTIINYELQQESKAIEIKKINIQKKVKNNTFFILQYYFEEELNIRLELSDLKTMDVKLLKSIDFKKMRRYRGFGKVAESQFKQLIDNYSF